MFEWKELGRFNIVVVVVLVLTVIFFGYEIIIHNLKNASVVAVIS